MIWGQAHVVKCFSYRGQLRLNVLLEFCQQPFNL
jgi:hypothetical protein